MSFCARVLNHFPLQLPAILYSKENILNSSTELLLAVERNDFVLEYKIAASHRVEWLLAVENSEISCWKHPFSFSGTPLSTKATSLEGKLYNFGSRV